MITNHFGCFILIPWYFSSHITLNPKPPPPTLFLQCEMCFLSPCPPAPSPLSLSLSLSRSLQLSSLQANAEAASIRIKNPRRGRPAICLFLRNLKTRFTCLAVFELNVQTVVGWWIWLFFFFPSLWTHQEKIIKQASFRLPTACFFLWYCCFEAHKIWVLTDRQTDRQRKKSVTGDSRLLRSEVWRAVWSRGCLM
jgi:hypothetical protein